MAPVDSILRTLDRFETDGLIDDFTVDAWPAEVRLGDSHPHSNVVDLFEAFDAWAAQRNVRIRPPFAVETRNSMITGETREVLITSVQCLAIYVNGVLVEVFPHTADRTGDDETYTVTDALTLLEEQAIQAFGAGPSSDTSPSQHTAAAPTSADPGICPACEARSITGQGVYACPDCDWVGIATGPDQYRSIAILATHNETVSTPNEDVLVPDVRR